MPLFQIRYHGPAAPDPETLLADDPEQAMVLARARFGASGAERATLSRAGIPMRGFLKNGDEVPSEDVAARHAGDHAVVEVQVRAADGGGGDLGLPNAFMAADLAFERNDRIDMRAWAGRAQIGYTFAEHRWKPTFTVGYQTFSGDDPDTARLERFDPLYYEGNPSAWSTGTKSSMVFINSNVNSWQVAASIAPTPRDTFTARLHRIEADQLRSPIQFGQATRVTVQNGVNSPITGVTRRRLSDDLYVEYFRAVSANLYLTTGFSVSVPGAGIKSVVEDAPVWAGGYANLIVNY